MHSQAGNLPSYIGAGVVILLVLGLRMRRLMQSRPYRLESSWVLPTILLGLMVVLIALNPPHGVGWVWILASFAVGAGLGWLRAMTIRMEVDPATRQVMAQGSALAVAFLVVLLVVRFGLRSLLEAQSVALGVSVVLVDGAFLAMACGLFVARAVEMNLRARKLLSATPVSLPPVAMAAD